MQLNLYTEVAILQAESFMPTMQGAIWIYASTTLYWWRLHAYLKLGGFFHFCSLDSALTIALWEILLSLSFVTKQNRQNIPGDIEIIRAVIIIFYDFWEN
jgi:hypothetical protein